MKRKPNIGIIGQIYSLAIMSIIIVGLITFATQYLISDASVKKQSESRAAEIADETIDSIKEYPAYQWLLQYWYENADQMDIEYDTDYVEGTRTKEKCDLLSKRHPGIQLKYLSTKEVEALSTEDQKLYAEVTYSWLLTRVNEIKQDHHINFLYCVLTDLEEGQHPYETQFFIFSGADAGSTRGTGPYEVYPIGMVIDIANNSDMQNALRTVVKQAESQSEDNQEPFVGHFEYSGRYADYYALLHTFDGHGIFVGISYKIAEMQSSIYTHAWGGTFIAVLFQIILMLLLIHLMSHYALTPLKGVLQNIRYYTKTKDSQTVTENLTDILQKRSSVAIKRNEIGELTNDVIELANEIDDHVAQIEAITAENKRIETELHLAAGIQASMLPRVFPAFPKRKEFDIYAMMDPAKEVGGDFYDFYMIDDDHLGLVIADVSGKGVPAALFMMIAKIIIQNCAMLGESAGRILQRTNDVICENNGMQMFVTVWTGILEISTGKLTAANAGHEYPFLLKNGEFDVLRDKHGFVIGGMENMKYHEYTVQLKPGDAIFVYTDGVTEANDDKQTLFGMNRLKDALNEDASGSCQEIITHVKAAVDRFVDHAPQFDDLTMLCVKYHGPQDK